MFYNWGCDHIRDPSWVINHTLKLEQKGHKTLYSESNTSKLGIDSCRDHVVRCYRSCLNRVTQDHANKIHSFVNKKFKTCIGGMFKINIPKL